MSRQTKKVSAQTTVTSVESTQKIVLTDANGKITIISMADLKKSMMAGMDLNAITDGVFIMYHRKSDNYPLMYKPEYWPSVQAGGEVADGVVIVEGGKVLVVAPTESSSTLLWSSAAVSGGGVTTSNRVTAYNDWAGKANTASQISKSTSAAVTNTASYAPGFCNTYSRTNANGYGLTAGKWWLPSMGEMMMMYANMNKINYALSLISGATPLVRDWYWTSTEYSSTNAWPLTLNSGSMNYTYYAKASGRIHVRAVSAFIS